MRNPTRELEAELKRFGRRITPLFECGFLGDCIESAVALDGWKAMAVPTQIVIRFCSDGIDLIRPMTAAPYGTTYPI